MLAHITGVAYVSICIISGINKDPKLLILPKSETKFIYVCVCELIIQFTF